MPDEPKQDIFQSIRPYKIRIGGGGVACVIYIYNDFQAGLCDYEYHSTCCRTGRTMGWERYNLANSRIR